MEKQFRMLLEKLPPMHPMVENLAQDPPVMKVKVLDPISAIVFEAIFIDSEYMCAN